MENKLENAMLSPRNVDMVFCIDGTGSMGNCIETVKKNANSFYTEFLAEMTRLNYEVQTVRIKLIVFRDYACDGAESMEISDFFELPTDLGEYQKALATITAKGGGDEKENGLEALYYAMRSDFLNKSPKDRQVIVLFTDTDALELLERKGSPDYPSDMGDLKSLQNMWACADQSCKLNKRAKRLVIFAPAGTKYEENYLQLEKMAFKSVKMDNGLADIGMDEIIKLLAATASGM